VWVDLFLETRESGRNVSGRNKVLIFVGSRAPRRRRAFNIKSRQAKGVEVRWKRSKRRRLRGDGDRERQDRAQAEGQTSAPDITGR